MNLLKVNSKHSLTPGDNDEMLLARDNFLYGGHYEPLAKEIVDIILKRNKHFKILDAGCGTGYYINIIQKDTQSSCVYGVDIAKKGVKLSAKKNKAVHFAVCSVFDVPFADSSFSTILNVFSPFAFDEYYRLLEKDGILISVYPGANHLIELKNQLYGDETILNDKHIEFGDFRLLEKKSICGTMHLCNSEIISLIKMTPYFYTTPSEKLNNLTKIETLDITYDFIIDVLGK